MMNHITRMTFRNFTRSADTLIMPEIFKKIKKMTYFERFRFGIIKRGKSIKIQNYIEYLSTVIMSDGVKSSEATGVPLD